MRNEKGNETLDRADDHLRGSGVFDCTNGIGQSSAAGTANLDCAARDEQVQVIENAVCLFPIRLKISDGRS